MALTMTLGHQNKMYNVIQHSAPQTNCVIVSQPSKTVLSGKRPLAPAPERGSVLVPNNNDLRCKRKIQFVPYGTPPQQPASVARRNARERNRVKQVNNGFATLRSHIPQSVAQALSPQSASQARGASKKLSKVETLRLAVEYIRSLQQMIDDHEGDMTNNQSIGGDSHNESRYYTSSPNSTHLYSTSYPVLLPTPTCSEASVVTRTPCITRKITRIMTPRARRTRSYWMRFFRGSKNKDRSKDCQASGSF
ncbi:hypothetical protein JTB14_019405 [Gonioctena quinquepunctata]|nr:hypothetical protein JTB14_019405 [Gonioctena quinquepunctata]